MTASRIGVCITPSDSGLLGALVGDEGSKVLKVLKVLNF